MRYVIIGGGIAGTTAAEEIRKIESAAEITLVSEEYEPLYSRVLLPHYAKGIVPREKIFLKKETWYAEKNIEWLAGTRCDAIDVRNKHVAISDGRELPYDKLLIATGGEVKTLPYEGENVCYFHSLGDTEHLIAKMMACEGRGVVYGGSFIAAELLDVFLHRGLATVAAFRGPWMFSRVLDAESGELISDHLRAKGAEVFPGMETLPVADPLLNLPLSKGEGTRSSPLLGKERVKGEVDITEHDVVGIGVGMEADLSWIRDAGIAVNRGVLANARLETNVPDVYAAGDIAEFDDVIAGRKLMAGNWPSAVMQGRLAGQNMAGQKPPGKSGEFRNVSSYATNLAGLDIIAVGDTDRAFAEEIRTVGGRAAGGVTQLFVRAGKVVGGTMVGRTADRTPVTNAIREGLASVRLA